MSKQRFADPFRWSIVVLGAAVTLLCASNLTASRLDLRFLLIALATVAISSRVAVKIPRHDSNITLSDAFVFIVILVYGGEAAVLLAAAEGFGSGLRISKTRKPVTILFNAALGAVSTFAAVCAVRLVYGAPETLPAQTPAIFVSVVCIMALAQYVANSGIVAVALACKIDQPVWQTWTKHCMWSSITHFVGAAAAGLVVNFIDAGGFYVFLVVIPAIFIVYLTYNKYLEDIKATAAQAEQAERARAEAEHERAELAERHIEEQKRYIAELERISKELEESREHFRHTAFHDSLTGLPNRALLTEHLKAALATFAERADHRFAVLFLDLDRFKNINDSLGHVAGDELLKVISRRLEACVRPGDVVARLGGDEFAILLDGLDTYSDALRVAERVQKELSVPFYLNGHEVYTTASIGVTLNLTRYEHPENILRDADTAMYHAKENGKARYELFDKDMHASAVRRLQLENDLRRAIEREEFKVYYQPIMSLATETLAGFEALVRWQHPERGLVSPDEFIPVAEETGLIMEIGLWVLRESCRQTSEWRRADDASSQALTISVNLSSKQFTQANLIGQVEEVLRETGLDPRALRLEITESVVMENAEVATSMLEQLRALGIQLSIDDFGTGYSSLSYLHRFPVDTLKIDRSFVSRMGAGDENAEIVRTVVTLATNLGMNVIAEGVETREQLTQLQALDCGYAQGYYFSRPLEAMAATAYINTHPARATTDAAPDMLDAESKQPRSNLLRIVA